MFLACALLASPASAARDGSADVVRELADRVGPIVGGALACREIVASRLQVIVDKFHTVIRDAAGNEAERADISQLFDRSVTDGTNMVTAGEINRQGEAGGVDGHGRMLKLIADDGYDPARALAAMKQLCESDQVFGYVGNGGSTLNFGRDEHQASHKIGGTSFDEAGISSRLTLNDFCGTARRRAGAAANGAFGSRSS
jgi:hypothetical protein